MKAILYKLLQRIRKTLKATVHTKELPTETGNHHIFNMTVSMKERLQRAVHEWRESGSGNNHLLTGEAFFAAQCWVFTHNVYSPESENHDPDIQEFVTASRALNGGDPGWHSMLHQRANCSECGTEWRMENILYCVVCMRFVCMDCQEAHTKICGDPLVG
jgi:hypothetical protein